MKGSASYPVLQQKILDFTGAVMKGSASHQVLPCVHQNMNADADAVQGFKTKDWTKILERLGYAVNGFSIFNIAANIVDLIKGSHSANYTYGITNTLATAQNIAETAKGFKEKNVPQKITNVGNTANSLLTSVSSFASLGSSSGAGTASKVMGATAAGSGILSGLASVVSHARENVSKKEKVKNIGSDILGITGNVLYTAAQFTKNKLPFGLNIAADVVTNPLALKGAGWLGSKCYRE